jgi:hypothetical protein
MLGEARCEFSTEVVVCGRERRGKIVELRRRRWGMPKSRESLELSCCSARRRPPRRPSMPPAVLYVAAVATVVITTVAAVAAFNQVSLSESGQYR